MRPAVSVIVPAYDEEARIGPVLTEMAQFLAQRGRPFEILAVDDGSTDGTAALIRAMQLQIPELQLVSSSPNRGKGHAVRLGMLAARGEARVMCDADGSAPPRALDALLAPLEAGEAEVVVGSRYMDGASTDQPLWRRLWSRFVNLILRVTLLPGLRDTQCGYKAFTADTARELFEQATIDGWAFDVEVLVLAQRRGHRIVEIGIPWWDDRRSRIRAGRDLGRILRDVVILWWRR